MLQMLAETIIDTGLQAIGWVVLKGITFGRYRGFRPEDILVEGTLGFATLGVLIYAGYRWLA